jgi:hypothetical protein
MNKRVVEAFAALNGILMGIATIGLLASSIAANEGSLSSYGVANVALGGMIFCTINLFGCFLINHVRKSE